MEPARPQPDCSATLTIESRDLDTDAREQSVINVVPPVEPGAQRAALAEAVAGLFPRARLRSFSNGAATFLDAQHLIVASYSELPKANRRDSGDAAEKQQKALFAA